MASGSNGGGKGRAAGMKAWREKKTSAGKRTPMKKSDVVPGPF